MGALRVLAKSVSGLRPPPDSYTIQGVAYGSLVQSHRQHQRVLGAGYDGLVEVRTLGQGITVAQAEGARREQRLLVPLTATIFESGHAECAVKGIKQTLARIRKVGVSAAMSRLSVIPRAAPGRISLPLLLAATPGTLIMRGANQECPHSHVPGNLFVCPEAHLRCR